MKAQITQQVERVRDQALADADGEIPLSAFIEAFMVDEEARAVLSEIQGAVNAEWLKRQFATALKDVADTDLENAGGQLSLFPKAMPMALSLGLNEAGRATWIHTPKATRRHLSRARSIRLKHIHDSQQRLENFDENVAVIEPAFDAGCHNVADALDWLAKQQRSAG